jgi:hypothetical protein
MDGGSGAQDDYNIVGDSPRKTLLELGKYNVVVMPKMLENSFMKLRNSTQSQVLRFEWDRRNFA